MAIISAMSIIRSLSIFHLTAAYFLLTAPATIADQNLVFILGAAMDLVSSSPSSFPPPLPFSPFRGLPNLTNPYLKPSPISAFTAPSPATALLGAVLALSAIADLTAAGSLPRESSSLYWSSQAPVRLLFFFAVTFYAYAFKPGELAVQGTALGTKAAGLGLGTAKGRPGWDELKNSLVFSWGFLEMMVWFWVSPAVSGRNVTSNILRFCFPLDGI